MTPLEPPAGDEFYIGYEPQMPPGIASHLARGVIAGVALAVLTAAGAMAFHHRLAPATFEYGHPQTAAGELRRSPYPRLLAAGRTTWLVGPGKSDADAALGDVAEGPVVLEGTRIARGPHTMLEVVPGSVRAAAPSGTRSVPAGPGTDGTGLVPPDAESAARQLEDAEITLHGEVVDSKCFLGVMNPGEGTVHRDCARVCLRGGIPPMLLVRGAEEEEALLLLVGSSGEPIGRQLADLAGQTVSVRGHLTRDGDTLILVTTPAQVARRAR